MGEDNIHRNFKSELIKDIVSRCSLVLIRKLTCVADIRVFEIHVMPTDIKSIVFHVAFRSFKCLDVGDNSTFPVHTFGYNTIGTGGQNISFDVSMILSVIEFATTILVVTVAAIEYFPVLIQYGNETRGLASTAMRDNHRHRILRGYLIGHVIHRFSATSIKRVKTIARILFKTLLEWNAPRTKILECTLIRTTL